MSDELPPGMTALDDEECWRLLASADVGRIAIVVDGRPEIFPVNFVVDGRTVVFRTAEGTKLAAIAIASRVALEIDGFEEDSGHAWSVVLKGLAWRLERFEDIYAAQKLPVYPWHDAPKPHYVRVGHATVCGRRFLARRGVRELD